MRSRFASSSNPELAREPTRPARGKVQRMEAAQARKPPLAEPTTPTDLHPEELTPLEQKFLNGEATEVEAEQALHLLGRRALESPDGYISVCGVPDDHDP